MMIVIIFFIFGLIIGSFFNVLVYRLRDAETLLGRSFCRQCKHQIRWYDNIPLLSFVLLRGQCRDCETKISWQYPAVEFITGVLFALVGLIFFVSGGDARMWWEIAWLVSIASCFVVIAIYDLRYMEIPLSLLVVSAVLAYGFFVADFLFVSEPFLASRLGLGLYGGVVVGGLFFALVFASRETWMGWGDVWLGFVAGSIVSLPYVLPMLTVAFSLGALAGLIAMVYQKKNMKSQIPFAPFLVSGTIIILFLAKAFPLWLYFFIIP